MSKQCDVLQRQWKTRTRERSNGLSQSILPLLQSSLTLSIVPIPLSEANLFVERMHRHNQPVRGAKFCIGVADETTGLLRGVVIVGRPISRMLQDGVTLEVTRCCTDGCPNGCSMLYSAARSAAFAQGYRRLVTYTLQSETMSSLKASGWELVAEVDSYQGKGWQSRPGRKDQEVARLPKYRWETYARSERQRRIFPVLLPWRQEAGNASSRRTLLSPEMLIFTGKGNQIDIAATVELMTKVVTEERGNFSAWDIDLAVESELLRAEACHLKVANPPTHEQVNHVLCTFAKRQPEQFISYGSGWFGWRNSNCLY